MRSPAFLSDLETIPVDKLYERLKESGCVLLKDDPEIAAFGKEQRKQHDKESDRVKASHKGQIFERCYYHLGIDHPHIRYEGNKLQSDAHFNARHMLSFSPSSASTEKEYYPDDQSFMKQFNELVRKNPLTKNVMARIDLVYKLYTIALAMVECGRAPDFSNAPAFNSDGAYKTPWVLPDPVGTSRTLGDNTRIFGGCGSLLNHLSSGPAQSYFSNSFECPFSSGGFGTNPIHKNSLGYVGPTHVYAITYKDEAYKYGESARGYRQSDGKSIRAEEQVRQLRRMYGEGFKSEILREYPSKKEAREGETQRIQRFRGFFGDNTLPGNKGKH
jgi:hypothetical protein